MEVPDMLVDLIANWTLVTTHTTTAQESAVSLIDFFSFFFTFVLKTGPGFEQFCRKFLILNPGGEKSDIHTIVSAALLK